MAKDLLLIGRIWEYNVIYFFDQIKEAQKEDPDTDFTLHINCEGGNPDYGVSIISKYLDIKEKTAVLIEGQAHSWAFFFMAYSKGQASACDTAQALLHRAAYSTDFEKSDYYKNSIHEQSLTKTNKDLEKALRNVMDVDAFENLPQVKKANIKLADIFSMDDRKEVLLSAQDLKKIGLIKKIVKVTPDKESTITAQFDRFSACNSLESYRKAAQAEATPPKEKPKAENIMTLAELKAQHPAIYAEAIADAQKAAHAAGVTAERERIDGLMAFNELDPKAVAEAIASGKDLTPRQKNDLMLKSAGLAAGKKIAGSSAPDVKTEGSAPDVILTPDQEAKKKKQDEIDAFEKATAAFVPGYKVPTATA